MKRIKAACILQTLVFKQKEDCCMSRESQLKYNREEVEKYIKTLERNRTIHKIVEKTEQPDGSVVIKIIKQYNASPVGDYLDD